jgi:hypothetical protein
MRMALIFLPPGGMEGDVFAGVDQFVFAAEDSVLEICLPLRLARVVLP